MPTPPVPPDTHGHADGPGPAPRNAGPDRFFVTAPLAAAAAGALVCVAGIDALRTGYSPTTLLLTHLGTLGFLGAAMFGVVYRITPLVAGARLPLPRSTTLVHAALVIGLFGVAAILGGGLDVTPHWGFGFVELAALVFVGTTGWALGRRATKRDETVRGMLLAVAALLLVALLGTVLERALGGEARPGARALWLQVHLTLAFLGWVGALIASVSWQVLPGFHGTPEVPRPARRGTLLPIAAGIVLCLAALPLEATERVEGGTFATVAATPAALAVWVWHPWTAARAIAAGPGALADVGLRFWSAGLATAPIVLVAGAWAALGNDPRAAVLFGWLAVWGWAGLIVHGLVVRLAPPTAPSPDDPSANARMRRGFVPHVASVAVGAAAIVLVNDALARAAGGLALIAAGLLLSAIVGARRRGRAE
ncbi:MAG: hypothetical protein ACF8XB_21985 [Planctomycetota bacterium JB042]